MYKSNFTILTILWMFLFSCNKKAENLASVKTVGIHSIKDHSALIIGEIIDNNGSNITSFGIVWSVNPEPTKQDNFVLGKDYNNFAVEISNLSPKSTYYVRAFVENKVGISYGNELKFSTTYTIVSSPGQNISDSEGNIYTTIVLGNGQEWMTQNLRTTTCSNGTSIPNIHDNTVWSNLSSPAWSYYKNNSSYNEPYGKLYNWYTLISCDVCPSGWRVPSKEDWDNLNSYLAPNSGDKMKVLGTQYWLGQNDNATNESGFSSIPSGIRFLDGTFNIGFDRDAYFWSSSETTTNTLGAFGAYNSYSSSELQVMGFMKVQGLNIRCIKN